MRITRIILQIIITTGWDIGAVAIITETGYSERWAIAIRNNLNVELATRNIGIKNYN